MAETTEWAFPERLQPRQENLHFDLDAALQSVVQVHSEIPDEAFTASVLGTERMGHGVVIGSDGLVLTIGYLITEAESIWLTANNGAVVPGHALAYDQVTGFGLVLPLGRLDVPTMQRGSASAAAVGDSVTVIGHGGLDHALDARIIARREFAGYWSTCSMSPSSRPRPIHSGAVRRSSVRTASCWVLAHCWCRKPRVPRPSMPTCLFPSTCSSPSWKTC